MTGKRFTLKDGLDILDNTTGEIIPPCLDRGLQELIDLLNALNDENEQLRHDATILIQSNQDYRKENEELKHRLAISEKANFVTTLEKENEQLRKELQEIKDFYKDYKPMWETVSIKEVKK